MAKMAELHAEGVTDLHSYSVGYQDALGRVRKILEEQKAKFASFETGYGPSSANMGARINAIDIALAAIDKETQ